MGTNEKTSKWMQEAKRYSPKEKKSATPRGPAPKLRISEESYENLKQNHAMKENGRSYQVSGVDENGQKLPPRRGKSKGTPREARKTAHLSPEEREARALAIEVFMNKKPIPNSELSEREQKSRFGKNGRHGRVKVLR